VADKEGRDRYTEIIAEEMQLLPRGGSDVSLVVAGGFARPR
jgi:hypothetical protein